MTDPNKEIQEMIYRYYRLIDAAAPVAELKTFFDPEGFEIVEDELTIDSPEKYGRWYETVNRTLVDRRHSIEHLDIIKGNDGYSDAAIQMHFSAKAAAGDSDAVKPIRVKAQIEWKLRHDSNSDRLYIVKYHIFKNQT